MSLSEQLDEFDLLVLRDYIADKWSSFVAFCEERGIDPDDIYRKLGGEG